MQWPMDVDFVKYLSGKSSKLLKVKHHDIPGVNSKIAMNIFILDSEKISESFLNNNR